MNVKYIYKAGKSTMCPLTLIRQETCRLANMVGFFFWGGAWSTEVIAQNSLFSLLFSRFFPTNFNIKRSL